MRVSSYLVFQSIGRRTPTDTNVAVGATDWTSESFDEDVFVDIRSYAKPERTREFVLDGLKQVQSAFADHNLVANVRCESYDGERYWHVPPSPK